MLVAGSDPRPFWFLVRAKPRQESKVTPALAARGIEAYCPRILEPRLHAWEPSGPVPMFPGYVFARFSVAEGFATVHYCSGAQGLVRFGDSFAALEESEVETLRRNEGERGFVEAPRRDFKPGARVRVVKGALLGIEGVVTHYLPAKQRVRVLLSLAWSGRPAELDARLVRRA